MLKSLDLFSGIGGLARALHGFATPQMYCEVDACCQLVLRNLFAKGLLDHAPVHGDVATLNASDVLSDIDIIVGGFPCVGMSPVGLRQGLENSHSALYIHILRLTDALTPKFLFLENVPNITNLALDRILEDLEGRGYDAWWMCLPGYAVGAPQTRVRWFCLGVRRDVQSMTLRLDRPFTAFQWEGTEPARMLEGAPAHKDTYENRLAQVGNSVIADCARMAFCTLFSGYTLTGQEALHAETLHLSRPSATGRPLPTTGAARRCGSSVHGVRERIQPCEIPSPPDLKLLLVPYAYVNPGGHHATHDMVLTEPRAARMWGTPRRGSRHACHVLTFRSKNDVYTQVRFERNTPDSVRGGHINPQWAEWLQGYPQDWTDHVATHAVSRTADT